MSTSRQGSASGGVRSLRDMFEKAPASSPPEPRGRSPAPSVASNGERPSAKIRASFVSVQPSGNVDVGSSDRAASSGVTSNPSGARRRESFSVNEADNADALEELKTTLSEEKEVRKRSLGLDEKDMEVAVETGGSNTPAVPIREEQAMRPFNDSLRRKFENLSAPTDAPRNGPLRKKSPVEGDQHLNTEQEDPKRRGLKAGSGSSSEAPARSAQGVASRRTDQKEKAPNRSAASQSNGESSANATAAAKRPHPLSLTASGDKQIKNSQRSPLPKSPLPGRSKSTVKPPRPSISQPQSKPSVTASRTKPQKSPTKQIAPRKAPEKSSGQTFGSSSRSQTGKEPAPSTAASSAPGKAYRPRASIMPLASPTSVPKLKPSSTPFTKPKPRSPTRPVALPSHLTAPTASSAAKHDLPRPSSSAALRRKPSVLTSDRTTRTKTPTALHKQPSRASLPGNAAALARRRESQGSHTSNRPAVPPDDGFLARMMRSTASSASKTHEKPEIKSPPRRTAVSRPKPSHAEAPAGKCGEKAGEEVLAQVGDDGDVGVEEHAQVEDDGKVDVGEAVDDQPEEPTVAEQIPSKVTPAADSETEDLEPQNGSVGEPAIPTIVTESSKSEPEPESEAEPEPEPEPEHELDPELELERKATPQQQTVVDNESLTQTPKFDGPVVR